VELTSKQKKQLKGLAHSMNPLVQVGKSGVSSEIVTELDRILTEHELIKVKISAMSKEDFTEIAESITDKVKAQLVHTIGRTAILYRETKNPDRKKIKLVK